jgi:hypothetical protein
MALDIKKPEAAAQAVAAPPETMVLELDLYKSYTYRGTTYTAGKAYRFRLATAVDLLGEKDCGRSIWKRYRPVVVKPVVQVVTDSTNVEIVDADEPIHGTDPEDGKQKRIDIGDDSEIADILNSPDNVEV